MKKSSIAAFLLAGVLICSMTGCGSDLGASIEAGSSAGAVEVISAQQAESSSDQAEHAVSITSTVSEDPEFHDVCVEMDPEEILAAGFEYGDSCTVTFSNGYQLEDIPFYSGYYGKTNDAVLVYYQGTKHIVLARCYGEPTWVESNCKDGDTVTITLEEKGRYLNCQNALNMTYSSDRADYSSDRCFANFRVMKGGSLAADTFYRGASPVDDRYKRALVVDQLLKKNHIGFVLDLADTEESLETYQATEGFSSDYYMSLYEQGKVVLLGLSSAYRSDDYRQKLAAGLVQLSENDGPYYIHCTEGKDRTGFVCILLESIAGSSVEELEADYMKTYNNYYGISEEDAEQYAAIMEQKFYDITLWLAGVDSREELEKADLEAAAKAYLLDSGMTEAEYTQLKAVVTA